MPGRSARRTGLASPFTDESRRDSKGPGVVVLSGSHRARLSAEIRKRNELIVQRVTKEGKSMAAVARRFLLTRTKGVADRAREAAAFVGSVSRAGPDRQKSSLTARHGQPAAAHPCQVPPTEQTIVQLVVSGMSSAAVARRFGLSERMVRWLVQRSS
jgi:DNA-binding NarL/FixJ family response regulator